MTVQFTCTTCKKTLPSSDDKVGDKVRCPGCKNILQVPSPEAKALTPSKDVKESEEWSYTKDGKSKIGPFSLAQFQMLARSGAIQPTDMVRKEGTAQWIPANTVIGLFSSSEIQTRPQEPVPATSEIQAKPPQLVSAAPMPSQDLPPVPNDKAAGRGIGWRYIGVGIGAVTCVTIILAIVFWGRLTGEASKDDRMAANGGVKGYSPKDEKDTPRTNGKGTSTTEPPKKEPSEKTPSGDRPDPPKKESSETKPVTDKGLEARLPEKGSLKDAQPSGISVVFSEGFGTTQDEALKDAFRNSVQRVVGVFVDSETLVKNDAIISDKVLTFSDGAIKKYEELDRSENKGVFRVKIKAAVESRKVAARLEAAHISMKAVDVKNIAEAFSKEIHADLQRLAHEITEKEARDNARKILENDLARISKINLIEAKVVGELERGNRVGNKLPLKVRVRYEVNEAAFHEAMTKLEKSLLMNSSSWGKITFLATPDLIMKRANQSTINEEIGKDKCFVLVNKGLASEKWRSHWNYYVLPLDAKTHAVKTVKKKGGISIVEYPSKINSFLHSLIEKKSLKIKLSLLDKDGQVVATDEFTADSTVRAFRYNFPTHVPSNRLNPNYVLDGKPAFSDGGRAFPAGGAIHGIFLRDIAIEYGIDVSSAAKDPGAIDRLLRSPQEPEYSTRPFNGICYVASPCFFNLSPDIRYMTGFEQVREIPFTLDEIKLIQSVKCELFP